MHMNLIRKIILCFFYKVYGNKIIFLESIPKKKCLGFMESSWDAQAKSSPLTAVDWTSGENEKLFDKFGKDIVDWILKKGYITKKSTTLHIGCGVGRFEKFICKNVKACYGIDISSEMISIAKQRLKKIHNVKLYKTQGNSLCMFVNNKFDFVYSIEVFQHLSIDIIEAYMSEAARVLKPGGFFLLTQGDIRTDNILKTKRIMKFLFREKIVNIPINLEGPGVSDYEKLGKKHGLLLIKENLDFPTREICKGINSSGRYLIFRRIRLK